MMKSLIKIYIFVLLIQLVFLKNSDSNKHQESGTLKSQQLRKLTYQAHDNFIMLNKTGYEYYVQQNPRPYDIVLYFTASNCQLCDQIEAELQHVIQAYKAANAFYPTKKNGKQQKATYFAKLSYNQDLSEVFAFHEFNVVPNLIVATQKLAYVSKIERQFFLRDYTWQISSTDGQVTASKLLEFINKKVQKDVAIKESLANLVFVLGFLASLAFIGFKLWQVILKKLITNKKIWMAGSSVIYLVCIGGVVSNIIHGTPFTNIDNNGEFEWWHSGGRHQFGAEGLIMSTLITGAGLIIAYLQNLVRSTNIFFILAIFSSYVMIRCVETLYKKKSWYGPQFYPPDHYIKGPLMRDQGNTV